MKFIKFMLSPKVFVIWLALAFAIITYAVVNEASFEDVVNQEQIFKEELKIRYGSLENARDYMIEKLSPLSQKSLRQVFFYGLEVRMEDFNQWRRLCRNYSSAIDLNVHAFQLCTKYKEIENGLLFR